MINIKEIGKQPQTIDQGKEGNRNFVFFFSIKYEPFKDQRLNVKGNKHDN
jgi:hypothetical protein